ncbi:MAG: alpha-amylase family glycosyl hydrolase [bacterium]|nr:alpha-amylase family glycosyl hydrolase [bacterium]
MFVNKIDNKYQSFKGYQHEVDNYGYNVVRINYPHSKDDKVQCECVILKRSNTDPSGLEVASSIGIIDIGETGGVINLDKIKKLPTDNHIGYRISVNGTPIKDTGLTTKDGYGIIPIKSPRIYGQAIHTMPQIQRADAYYADFNNPETGKILFDKERQKNAEKIITNISTPDNGGLAGLESSIKDWHNMGIKRVFTTPIWGGDNKSAHHYWTKNNMQISDNVGNIENYKSFIRELFKNGIQHVDDAAYTSEGLEGIHFQYAIRWKNQNPQTYYWFKMNGIKDNPLTLGVVPKNNKNLRHRIINPSVIYNSEKQKIEPNPNYDPHKETYFQIYDDSLISDKQRKDTNKIIDKYENLVSENELAINGRDDTVINYVFEIRPEEYENRLNELIKYNKNNPTPITLNSPEGTIFIGQFSGFKIDTNASGALFWDDNKDLVKMNFHISGYDEKNLQAITSEHARAYERTLIERGACEVQDMIIQSGKYKAQLINDTQNLYVAQLIQNAKNEDEISKLIGKGLPEEAKLSQKEIDNILSPWYNSNQKWEKDTSNITIKALMKLPLDSLELGDNTVGVLSTSYFSNRAINQNSIGMTRYEMYKKDLGYGEPYCRTYNKIDNLFANEIKDFADEVIKKLNSKSSEKLLDTNGNYTTYGKYVINHIGQDISKYAFLKALAGDKLQTKVISDDVLKGEITYNYPELKEITTLKALGIDANSPTAEAISLANIIIDGMNKNLTLKDTDYLADALYKKIEGTNTNSFKLAEAMVNKAGLGLSVRADALKDVADMDSVRNGDMTFDEAWDQVIDFWKKYVKEIKEINPNAYIVGEITDLGYIMQDLFGHNTNVYDRDLSALNNCKYKNVEDAMIKFFNETGMSSETGYSYTFTDLLRVFSADFEKGEISDNRWKSQNFVNRIKTLMATRDIDYIRNLWTFADNHDKPSVIHGMALDMGLFHSSLDTFDLQDGIVPFNPEKNRDARIDVLKEMTNSDRFEDLPLEAMLNIDNIEYFRTANTRAVAMAKLMRSCINEEMGLSEGMKRKLKEALTDIINGNYLKLKTNPYIQTITIPELQSFENALNSIVGNSLTNEQKQQIIRYAKNPEIIKKYAIRGDFDWKEPQWLYNENQNKAHTILDNSDWDLMKYSQHTVSLAAILTDAYKNVIGENGFDSFKNSAKEFIHKYDRATVEKSKSQQLLRNSSQQNEQLNGFASRDFETVIEMIIKQAELNNGMNFTQNEHDLILRKLFRASTEPAIQKTLMYATCLAGLPGTPSVYMRDVLGGLGYDEKAKNISLQDRNVTKWAELEEGPLKNYRNEILERFKEILAIRSTAGVEPINNGTPYILETNNNEIPAFMYQDSKGNVAFSVLNLSDIDSHNRHDYTANRSCANNVNTINNENKYVPVQSDKEIDGLILPAGLALTAGMMFKNINGNDTNEYIVKLEDGIYKLVEKVSNKIKLNGKTTKNGVMILKHIPFRGNSINKQYNIVTNPYAKKDNSINGSKLLIVAK